MFYEKSSAEVE